MQLAQASALTVITMLASDCSLSLSHTQRASCSLGTTSPTSATSQVTSCAATGGASRVPGSVTGCLTASTRVTRRNAVSGCLWLWVGLDKGRIPDQELEVQLDVDLAPCLLGAAGPAAPLSWSSMDHAEV